MSRWHLRRLIRQIVRKLMNRQCTVRRVNAAAGSDQSNSQLAMEYAVELLTDMMSHRPEAVAAVTNYPEELINLFVKIHRCLETEKAQPAPTQ